MFVITRNGKTTVYSGWRAWLMLGVSLAVVWALLALLVAAFIGVAFTIGIVLLLFIPAVVLVGLISGLIGQDRPQGLD